MVKVIRIDLAKAHQQQTTKSTPSDIINREDFDVEYLICKKDNSLLKCMACLV